MTDPESPLDRRTLDLEAAEKGVDLVVVGGGITGAGAARDAALRGLKVAVVEQGDWGSGTSSKSSKLVHGGLRYLENLQFGLVMEGTRERHRQSRLNPHLVTPLPFLMPVYKSGKHGILKINVGLWLYDLLSLFRTPRVHRRLSVDKTLARMPELRPDALSGSLLYFDCQTDDARLTLANILDARRHGAIALARATYRGPEVQGERVSGARVHDALLGREVVIPCRHIVHATGPWTDRTGALLGEAARLRPTKGVHVVVARERLPIELAVAMSSIDDGRVVFAVPFGNTTYVGTTDTDYEGAPEDAVATPEDVDYLLRTANHFFPRQALVPADVRSTWAGLRPLIRSDAATAYKTSREHEIYRDPRGLTTIAGGKLTTYRAMAEELVDEVLADLRANARRNGGSVIRARRCTTAKVPIDARARDARLAASDDLAKVLWHSHGGLADTVRARMQSHPEEARTIVPELPYRVAQVAVATLHEDAWGLEDLFVRRLQVFYRSADQGLAAAEPMARLMAQLLGRDEAWVAAEVAHYRAYVAAQLACARRPPTEKGAPEPAAAKLLA
jgi:glycerol-3-phosphate dehydrogenase